MRLAVVAEEDHDRVFGETIRFQFVQKGSDLAIQFGGSVEIFGPVLAGQPDDRESRVATRLWPGRRVSGRGKRGVFPEG